MRRGRCWLVLPVFLLLQLHLHSAAAAPEPAKDHHEDDVKAHTDSYAPSYPGSGECEPGFGFKPWVKPKYYADETKGTCELCDLGYYAPGGFAPCRPCGTPIDGFTTPNGAHKPDQCFCKPGFGGVGCDVCPRGTFSTGGTKDEPRAACTPCSNDALSKEGSTSARDCGCPPGRGGPNCIICPVGKYGPGGVNAMGEVRNCQNCTENQVTLNEGATSESQCVCSPGYAGPFCLACSADQICPGGSKDDPTRCPANSVSPPGNGTFSPRDCVCKTGYGRPADSVAECKDCPLCELCPAGTYSSGDGRESCKTCPAGQTSPPGTAGPCTNCTKGEYLEGGVCIGCPLGTTTAAQASVGKEACNICVKGFGLQPCPGSSGGNCMSCQVCPPGTYQDKDDAVAPMGAFCKACRPGQTSPAGSTNSTQCKECEKDEYEENGVCLSCPIGSLAGSDSGRGKGSCKLCGPGYSPQPCTGGKEGCVSCQPCPAGSFKVLASSPSTALLDSCTPCPDGSTSKPGATLPTDCDCKPGYGREGTSCNMCRIGTYSIQTTLLGLSVRKCEPCAKGKTTLQPGSTSVTDCVCDVGNGGSKCDPCGYPFYQGRLNDCGVPVTTATPGNPTPSCLRCNLVSTAYVLGSPDRTCVTSNNGRAGAYCVKESNPTGLPGAEVAPACAPAGSRSEGAADTPLAEESNTTLSEGPV